MMVLEVLQHVIAGDPERKIERLQRQLDEVELEAKQIRRKIAKLQRTPDT